MSVTLACTVGVALVGLVDYLTGAEARVFPLYYLPIAVGALRVSRAAGLYLAALSTALWALAMWLSGTPWGPGVLAFNTATQLVSFVVVAVLVANLATRFQEERDLSRNDALTSLPNSRGFYELAEILVAGSRRSGRPLTIAYIDLDNFKTVNDEQGHLQGDRALQEVAQVLRRGTRGADVAARLGGDEFAVLLPDTGPEAARAVLERLSAQLAISMQERQWPITASIGAVSYLRLPETVAAAVHGADTLMYQVKQAGKNRVMVETCSDGVVPRALDGRTKRPSSTA